MSGHAVTQTVDMSAFGDAAFLESATKSPLQRAAVNGAEVVGDAVFEAMACDGGKKPDRRTMGRPELAQLVEGLLGEGDEALFIALACDAQEHAGGVEVLDLQTASFIQAQGAGIDGGEANPVNGSAHAGEDFWDFLPAEDDGKLLGPGRAQEFEAGPITLEGALEEEFDAAEGDGGGGAGDFLFEGEVEEVPAQFLFGDEVRGFSIMPGQSDDRADIAGLSFGGITVELHILQETFT